MSSCKSRFQYLYRAASLTGGGKRIWGVEGEFWVPRELMPQKGVEHDQQLTWQCINARNTGLWRAATSEHM
jgi:hypothetical protein